MPLHGEDARTRNKFVLATESTKDSIMKRREEILESYCEKGEDGKAIIENGQYKLSEGKEEEAKKELTTFLESDSGLALDRKMYKPIALVLEKNVKGAFSIEEGKEYYKIIDILESL